MKKALIMLVSSVLLAQSLYAGNNNVDYYRVGCEDLIANQMTSEAYLAIGYITGVKDMKMDRLDKMGFDAVVNFRGKDFTPICRNAFKIYNDEKYRKYGFVFALNIATRAHVINKNGFDWKEVDKVCKETMKKMGTIKKKKY
jgi:hypothetical protein